MSAAPPAPAGDDALRGILFMCVAVTLFPFLNGTAKLLGGEYSIVQVVWARYLGHLVFMILAFAPRRRASLFATRRPGMQIFRSLLLFGATACYFSALMTLSLPTAAAINFLGPLAVTALSVPILGEHVGLRRWAAVGIGLVGALIIIRPGFGVYHWASLLVLGSVACNSLYQVISRKISAHDSAETSITYIAVVGLTVASLAVPFYWRWPVEPWHWAAFAALGLFGGFGHYFIVLAFGRAPAAVLSPFNYGQLIGATAIGYVVFGDFPDGWTWVGAGVIVASGLYVTYRESRQGRAGKVAATPS